MAVPAYATDLTDIYLDTDNFTTVGGGRVTAAETDDYIQGNNCWSHDPFSSGIEGGVYDTVTAETIATGDAVFIWTKCDVAATLATHAAGGVQALIGDAPTALKCFYVRGSDDYAYGGWQCIPVDPTKTASTNIGTPSGVWDHFGVRWNVPGTGAAKGYPMKIDAMRHGKTLEITAGEVANPASWSATATYDSTTTRQWGLCQPTATGAEIQGNIFWGTAAALVYSRDSNKTITIIDTEWVDTDFTQIIFAHASNDVVWDNVGLIALGTNNRGIIDVTANGTVTWTNSVFQGIDVTNLLTNSTFDGTKWLNTNAVTPAGASMLNCQIITPTVVANTSGLIWNVATDPSGKLDGMEFSKGTNAHHAIEFGTTSPLTMTLVGMDFTGFSASNNVNDSCFHVKRTSGTVTINLNGCTTDAAGSVFSYRSDGATVVVASSYLLTLTDIPTGVQVTIVNSSTRTELQHTVSTGADITYAHSGGETVDILLMSNAYDPNASDIYNLTLPNNDSSIKFQMTDDPNYDNPS